MKSSEANSRRSFLKGAAATPLLIAGSAALAGKPEQPAASMVGPSTVNTVFMTVAPVIGSFIVALGSSTASMFWPLPPAPGSA